MLIIYYFTVVYCSIFAVTFAAAPSGYSLYSSSFTLAITNKWNGGGTYTLSFSLPYGLPQNALLYFEMNKAYTWISMSGPMWTDFSPDIQTYNEGKPMVSFYTTSDHSFGSRQISIALNLNTMINTPSTRDISSATVFISRINPTPSPSTSPTYLNNNLVPTSSPTKQATPTDSPAMSSIAPTAFLTSEPVQTPATNSTAGASTGGNSSSSSVAPLVMGFLYVLLIVLVGAAILLYREKRRRSKLSSWRATEHSERKSLMGSRKGSFGSIRPTTEPTLPKNTSA